MRPPSDCHPEKPAVARGLCGTCYHRKWKRGSLNAPEGAAPLPELSGPVALARTRATTKRLTLAEAVLETEQLLIAALPEAAAALFRTLASDPNRGYALKAAQTLLQQFPVASASGSRRLLEAAAKEAPTASAQVVIGLHVTSPGDVRVGQVVGSIGPSHPAKKPGIKPVG